MPTITTAESPSIAGPRPLPHTAAFLQWVDTYISKRSRQCQRRRTQVYYIDPGAADNSQGTAALPWNNLGRVRQWLTDNPSGDARFLFRRGTILRDTIGLVLTRPNLYFGAYGRPVVGNTTDKPIISHFTVRWASGGSRWTQQGGTARWTSSVAVGASGSSANPNLAGGSPATTVGFVRIADDPFAALIAVGSTAAVESTPGSFFVNAGTVHINVDGNPNNLNIEAVPVQASPPDGFSVQNGSTGIWINGIRTDGWGCGAIGLAVRSSSGANVSGIRNLAGGTAEQAEHVALITNCESYYNGAHAISQEPGDIGGTHIVIGCVAGYGYNGNNGEALFNTYAGSARQECVFKECVARFGALPQNVQVDPITQGMAIGKQAGAFYGHQGGNTHPVGLYLNIDCRIADERATYPTATTYSDKWTFSEGADSMFAGTTAADPSSIRAFVIGFKSPRSRTVDATFDFNTNKPPAMTVARMIFINCHFYKRRTWSVTFADPVWQFFQGMAINCIFELDDEIGDRTALFDYPTSYATGARLINCMILARGAMAANASDDQVCISDANAKDRVRLANTVVLGIDRVMDPTNGLRVNLSRNTFPTTSLINDPESIRQVAVAGCLLADSGAYRGFSNATGLVQLETPNDTYPDLANMIGSGSPGASFWTSTYTLDPASPLAGVGAAVPFADKSDMLPAPQYDFFGRPRPRVPSIGPFDVPEEATGGFGRSIIRSVVV